jgi:2-polyprenyl-3-methyl-5-hydroxy-6-metoxy-1,4-benzoquinol methylase
VTPEPLAEGGVIIGNVFDKYHSRNPVVRHLMAGYQRGLDALLAQTGSPASVLEVGCGEGHVTAHVASRFPRARVMGTDFSATIVGIARREHPELSFGVSSIYDAATLGHWDVVLACEVMEHLEEPARALDAICATSPSHVVITVPREPLWRVLNMVRGRYWPSLGNTTGHLQHWSRSSLLAFLSTRLEIVDVRTPTPWTQVLGRPRP